ncbi:MAG: CDP-glycerol glycerophosphotransferase family protein [Eubacteriales bacterium]|nr:CDP-glycerol glycerophosphotransferase family protein [Eubacteriales bacterium]
MIEEIKDKLIRIVYQLFRRFPIKKDRVLLFSYYGEQFAGAPKYIGTYLKQNSGLDTIWAFVNPEKYIDYFSNNEMVRYRHTAYYFMLATAGTIITDYRMTAEFVKRPGQLYIQTWHSSLRLKQIENDAANTLPKGYIQMAKKDSAQIDILLAGSRKSKEIYRRAFWYDGLIAETGTPQCDILVRQDQAITKKVLRHFEIPWGSHIIMYAPTFRKNHSTSVYDLDATVVLKALRERFGGEWYLLLRLHPHLKKNLTFFEYSEHVIQATDYDDVQELICAADFLISDYSAIMFDFSVTGRPCILYTPDIDEYVEQDRKLYFDLQTLPFQSFRKQEELIRAIEHFDENAYQKALDEFRSSIGSYDDGKACERVWRLIQKGL